MVEKPKLSTGYRLFSTVSGFHGDQPSGDHVRLTRLEEIGAQHSADRLQPASI